MNYKVHKNILDDELYGIIHDLFNGNQFPWYYQKSTLHESHYYDDNEFNKKPKIAKRRLGSN